MFSASFLFDHGIMRPWRACHILEALPARDLFACKPVSSPDFPSQSQAVDAENTDNAL
jgi:hypothetical protein